VSKNIRIAIDMAERSCGQDIREVYLNFGANHITCKNSRGVIAVSSPDGEVTEGDVARAVTAARAISLPQNREIVHIIPRLFYLDGQDGIKDPRGMNGVRLEVDSLVIEAGSPFIKTLYKAVDEADLEVRALTLSSLAAAEAVLSKRQKELGVLLLDIGGGTTSLAVIEEGSVIHIANLPIGGGHITNDIAIGLRTSVDIAEKIKIEYGSVSSDSVSKKNNINLSTIGEGAEDLVVSRKQVVEIIEARVEEILSMVQKELKKIDRQGLLPAGVVLIGGSVKLPGMIQLVKKELGLPTQIGYPNEVDGIMDQVSDPELATAVGLAVWGAAQDGGGGNSIINIGKDTITDAVDKTIKWVKNFLP
ncbi:MAG: cell division protein FtsA, partial [Candidatus Portnoybacteria bacterium CG10_big_fil_rev_8_21_14_0_10_36_7]